MHDFTVTLDARIQPTFSLACLLFISPFRLSSFLLTYKNTFPFFYFPLLLIEFLFPLSRFCLYLSFFVNHCLGIRSPDHILPMLLPLPLQHSSPHFNPRHSSLLFLSLYFHAALFNSCFFLCLD